ncbi:hypothetical protein Tco_1316073 [Tanacetum coccineum]
MITTPCLAYITLQRLGTLPRELQYPTAPGAPSDFYNLGLKQRVLKDGAFFIEIVDRWDPVGLVPTRRLGQRVRQGSQILAFRMKTIPVGQSPFSCCLLATSISLFLLFMSRSEPGEMAPESSQAVVLPKFDMHVYTSILTAKELKEAITEYCIPTDLHPRLPPPDLTMNRLPLKYIGIYIEQLEKGGVATCRHPELAYNIKDQDGKGNLYDTVLLFSDANFGVLSYLHIFFCGDHYGRLFETSGMEWNSREQRRPYPRQSTSEALEKKDQQILAKAQAKRAKEGSSVAPCKKRVRKNQEPSVSGSERTLSPTPLHHATLTNVDETTTAIPNDTSGNVVDVEKEVVDLSGNTRMTPPVTVANHPSPRYEHDNSQENVVFSDGMFSYSSSLDTEEDAANRRFMPNWGLHDDIHICTFRACKELISHLATPAEEECLGNLTNVEVISRAYQSLGQFRLPEDRPSETDVGEQWVVEEVKRIRNLEEVLEPKSRQLATAEELIKFIMAVVRKLHTSVEYRKSLDAPVADSYHLSVYALMKVSLDVPPSTPKDGTEASTADDTGNAAQRSPLRVQETVADTPFGTTT